MKNETDYKVTREMLAHYNELNSKKKVIEAQLTDLKKFFNQYFDVAVGKDMKGDVTISDYKLQRQIRKTEKFDQEVTIKRLEELNMMDLIKKIPDEIKIKSALNLGLLKEIDLEGCLTTHSSHAILVKHQKESS